MKHEKCYVLYSDEKYFKTVCKCAESIRSISEIPIIVYLINFDEKIEVENVLTVRWDCDISEDERSRYSLDGENFYINRYNKSIYSILMQRPRIVSHALQNYAEVVAYVDGDSIATENADRIFGLFDPASDHPAFVEGIYDILFLNGRGSASDYTKTLEYPACELFGADQNIRKRYRQTGYFVAGQSCIPFIEEWHEMCSHPKVLEENWLYAPFNEETIVNVLLWKNKILDGLPYIYVNIGTSELEEIYSTGFNGRKNFIKDWVAIPEFEENMMFLHGEKNPERMDELIRKIKSRLK